MQRTCAIKKNRFSSFAWLFYYFFLRFFLFFLFMLIFFHLFTFISLLPLFLMACLADIMLLLRFCALCRAIRAWTLYCVQFQFFWDISSSYTREWRSIQLKKNDRSFLIVSDDVRCFPIRYNIKTKIHLQKVWKETYTPHSV